MALVLADRVKETTNTTGTGAISLSGASTGFQGFSVIIGDGNTTYYAISSALGSEFEVGVGTYTQSSDELSRDTVLASSNGGSLVDFSAGTKDVYVVYPADKAVYKDESGVVPATTFTSVALTTGTVSTQPSAANGIANKAYVDEVAQGLQAKPADDVATTANLDATYDNGTSGVGATLTANANGAFPTIDGYDLSVGGTILVKDQNDLLENGSYELTDAGSSTTPWVLTRATLVDETDEVRGAFEFVVNGTTLSGSGFVATVPEDFLIGSSNATTDSNGFTQRGDIEWVQFSGAGTFTAGTGLDLSGTEFSLQKLGIEDLADPGADRILFYDNSAGSTEWLTVGSNLTLSGTTLSADQQAPTAGTAIDVSGTTVSLDLSELTTSTSNADGDFFVVVDSANAQRKLTKANINVSDFNNDAGYTSGNDTITLSGDVTGSGTTSISVTVQDDSHNHIISNVDGLQGALDAKVPTSRTITAGTGLSGGGNLTSDRTLAVDLNELSSSTSNADGDFFVVVDSADGSQHKLTKSNINVGGFNNDAGYLIQNETITLGGDVTGSGRDSITVSVNNDSHSHTGSTISGLGTSNFAGAALQTSAEAFSDSDTVIMTAAAVNDRIQSFGYSTTTGTVTSVAVSAGTGLSGGGTVTSSGTITLNVDLNELGSSTSNSDGDFFVVVDSADGSQHKLSKGSINISGFNNDAGYTTNVGDITNVSAGSGLTGGGASGSVTLNHADTSSQGSVNNSGGTVIQDVTLDGFGHVTNLNSVNLDSRYLGASDKAADADQLDGLNSTQFLRSDTSDTMSGRLEMANVLDMNNNDIQGVDQIFHHGDTNTYMQFHSSDQWRVVTGGSERLEVNNFEISARRQLDMNGNRIVDVEDLFIRDRIYHSGDTDTQIRLRNNRIEFVTGGSERMEINNSETAVSGNLVAGSLFNEGFDFKLGFGDQSSRGDSGESRALVKDSGNVLAMNFGADFSGGVYVQSNFGKASGSFNIDHPLPELSDTHQLVHSFVESPLADNVYRGVAELVNGTAQVNIDEYVGMTEGTFSALNGNPQIFLQNETGWEPLKGEVIDNILYVYCKGTTSTDRVSWMVVAERQDQHMLDTKWTDDFGRPILEPEKIKRDS